MKGKQTKRGRERERFSIYWFTPPKIPMARTGLGRNQKLLLGVPHGDGGLSSWDIFGCFPRHTNRELEWECSTWDLKQHPYGMLLLQEEA